MADGDLPLLLDVRQERSFVIDFEGKNAMLVWCSEVGGVCRAVGRGMGWDKWDTVERRKHAKFELK